MIKNLVVNIQNTVNLKGTITDKLASFITINQLQIKSFFNGRKDKIVSGKFFNFNVYSYDYLSLAYLFKEVFMSNEYYFEPATRKPLIIDCGANIGMSVLYFKKLYPLSRVIAFEANPHAYKLLESNMVENNVENVELHNIALYDKETEISFFVGSNAGTVTGSIKKDRGGLRELRVKTHRLSQFLENLESVDLIKMDVEGAELNILTDLINSSTINKAKEYIIEYHHNMKEDKSMLGGFLQKFEDNGFSYNIKSHYKKLHSFQDILIHFYKKKVSTPGN